jgi:O-antigen/teichoic acid export membrane protein
MNSLTQLLQVRRELVVLFIGKIAIFGFIYATNMFLAVRLGAASYGEITFLIFLIKSAPLVSIGLSQGYIYFYLSKKIEAFKETYVYTYILFYLVSFVTLHTFGFHNIANLALPVFIFQLAEPEFRAKRMFLIAQFPELVLVASFAVAAVLQQYISLDIVYAANIFSILFSVSAILLVYRKKFKQFFDDVGPPRINNSAFIKIVQKGIPGFLTTAAFFYFLFVDRVSIEKNFGDEALGVLMLSFQFAIVANFFSMIINVTSIVDIGELAVESSKELRSYLIKRLSYIFIINVTAISIIYLFIFFQEDNWFSNYRGLDYLFPVIALSYLSYNLFTSVSPVLYYLDKQFLSLVAFVVPAILPSIIYRNDHLIFTSLLMQELAVHAIFVVSMAISILIIIFAVLPQSERTK